MEFTLLSGGWCPTFYFLFAKMNFIMMSPQKRQSLFQELHGVSPSSRRVIISAKQLMEKTMEHPIINPFEEHLAGPLGGRKTVPSEYLRVFIGQVCEQTRQDFDGPRRLSCSTNKRNPRVDKRILRRNWSRVYVCGCQPEKDVHPAVASIPYQRRMTSGSVYNR
jgi:hypothetical protein